jgi:hypothetical protein
MFSLLPPLPPEFSALFEPDRSRADCGRRSRRRKLVFRDANTMPAARKRMPKVMVGTPNRGLSFAGNAGRTFPDNTHPEHENRG